MEEKNNGRPLHVCLLAGAYPPVRCGVGDYTARLAQTLAQSGVRVSVITSGPADGASPAGGVEVYPVVRSWGITGLKPLLAQLRQINPDVVHLQYPGTGFGRGLGPNVLFPWLAWQFPAMLRAITLHEYVMYSWRGKLRLWPALAAGQVRICTNQRDRHALRRWHAYWQTARVIPLGSVVDTGEPAGMKFKGHDIRYPEVCRSLIYFGTVMPNKGWDVLLPALRQLQSPGYRVRLDAVAELCPERHAFHARVEKLIQVLDLAGTVSFRGYLPAFAVHEVFKQSSGIAVAPFHGGASLNRSSLIALLRAGLAVVTTRPRRPLEGLRHGEHLWLVAPDQAQALAEGVRTLCDDPNLVRCLQAGARRAAARFAWPRIAQQHLKAYGAED
jgi:glycosyltransferase involved in cell wall biosynthesis